ncbi:MAG: hypothetical protein AAGE52_11395 [Myxococcota bacterium]
MKNTLFLASVIATMGTADALAQCDVTPIAVSSVTTEPRTPPFGPGATAVFTADGGAGQTAEGVPFDVRVTVVSGELREFRVAGDDMAFRADQLGAIQLRIEHIDAEGELVAVCPDLIYSDLEAGTVLERLTIDTALIASYSLSGDTVLEVEPVLPALTQITPDSESEICDAGEPRCAARVQHVALSSFEVGFAVLPNSDTVPNRTFTIDGDGDAVTFGDDVVVCGDGVVEGSEVCDDGNDDATDGCTPSCFLSDGAACSDAAECVSRMCPGGFCEGLCGNGRVDPGEPCDGGDDCTSDCRLALGAECTTGSVCVSGICSGSSNTCAECELAATCGTEFTCTDERCVAIPGTDAGPGDAGPDDAGPDDAGVDDGGLDAGGSDAAVADAGTSPTVSGVAGGGCSAAGSSPGGLLLLLGMLLWTRRNA